MLDSENAGHRHDVLAIGVAALALVICRLVLHARLCEAVVAAESFVAADGAGAALVLALFEPCGIAGRSGLRNGWDHVEHRSRCAAERLPATLRKQRRTKA